MILGVILAGYESKFWVILPFSIQGIQKGSFCQNGIQKGKELDLRVEALQKKLYRVLLLGVLGSLGAVIKQGL